MPQQFKQAVDAWRLADANAKRAEALLSAAFERELHDSTGASDALIAEVRRLRTEANERLTEALESTGFGRSPDRPPHLQTGEGSRLPMKP